MNVALIDGESIENSHLFETIHADEYERMADVGILDEDERVELIAGRILKMSPKGLGHTVANERAYRCSFTKLGDRAIVRSQNPIRLDALSEPEPDIVVAQPHEREYIDHHPRADEILLVLEVADSSLMYDRRTKSLFYARARIPQFVIVNLQTRVIEDYREPEPGLSSQGDLPSRKHFTRGISRRLDTSCGAAPSSDLESSNSPDWIHRSLHCLDVVQQHLLVPFRMYSLVNLLQIAVWIDHKGRAVPVHRAFVVALAHAGC